MAAPYIPPTDAGFDSWLANFNNLLTASPSTYGLTAPAAVIVGGVTSTWAAAYALAIAPATRTSVTVAAKDAARVNAEAIVRPYAISISNNPAVANGDKTAIGVTVKITVPTPVPAPTDAPELGVQSSIPLLQTLTYKQPGSAGKYKPPGVTGMEVWRSVGTVPAVDPAQAGYVSTVTKSPFRQAFYAPDQGKVATYFARWVTRSGPGGVAQPGPFSAPLVVTVM